MVDVLLLRLLIILLLCSPLSTLDLTVVGAVVLLTLVALGLVLFRLIGLAVVEDGFVLSWCIVIMFFGTTFVGLDSV